jgi:hypothetical protein
MYAEYSDHRDYFSNFKDSAETEPATDSSAQAQAQAPAQAPPPAPAQTQATPQSGGTPPAPAPSQNPAQSGQPQAGPSNSQQAPNAKLSDYGERQFYYNQSDHIQNGNANFSRLRYAGAFRPSLAVSTAKRSYVNGAASEGVCQAATFTWVAERLQTSNSPRPGFQLVNNLRKNFPKENDAESQAQRMTPEKRGQNAAITARVARNNVPSVAKDKESGVDKLGGTMQSEARKTATLAHLGLSPAPDNPGDAEEPILKPDTTTRPDENGRHEQVEFSQAFEKTANRLQPGQAATLEFGIRDGGEPKAKHTVALYKSRGNTLRFFDPNYGEFKVTDPGNFFKTYQTTLEQKHGWEVGFDTASRNYPDQVQFYERGKAPQSAQPAAEPDPEENDPSFSFGGR